MRLGLRGDRRGSGDDYPSNFFFRFFAEAADFRVLHCDIHFVSLGRLSLSDYRHEFSYLLVMKRLLLSWYLGPSIPAEINLNFILVNT